MENEVTISAKSLTELHSKRLDLEIKGYEVIGRPYTVFNIVTTYFLQMTINDNNLIIL